jgi:hypothetical protein
MWPFYCCWTVIWPCRSHGLAHQVSHPLPDHLLYAPCSCLNSCLSCGRHPKPRSHQSVARGTACRSCSGDKSRSRETGPRWMARTSRLGALEVRCTFALIIHFDESPFVIARHGQQPAPAGQCAWARSAPLPVVVRSSHSLAGRARCLETVHCAGPQLAHARFTMNGRNLCSRSGQSVLSWGI